MPRKTDHPGVTVSRNRHGKYYARWRDPDTGQWVSEAFSKHGYTTKTNAADWLKRKSRELTEARRRASISGPQTNVASTWDNIQSAYLDHFESEHGKDASERLKRDWLRYWRDFLDAQRVRKGGDLMPLHLMQFRMRLGSDSINLKPATRNRCLGSVRAYLSWAIDAEYLRVNGDHLRKHLKPFKVPRYQPRVLKAAELRNMLSKLVEHDTELWSCTRQGRFRGKTAVAKDRPKFQALGKFTILALLTGARPGEVLSMKWRDVDLEAGEIRVWGSKTQRERIIPLHDSPALTDFLSTLKLRSKGIVHVCGDWSSGKPTEIHDRQWRRLMKLAALEGTPMKALRSTTIAHVASASPDSEYLLEARFGHGANVSKQHYRRPLHGLRGRGSTVEQWLGIEDELGAACLALGLTAKQEAHDGTKEKSAKRGRVTA
jgi:integrase